MNTFSPSRRQWLQRPLCRWVVFALLVGVAFVQLSLAFFEQGVFSDPSQQSFLSRRVHNPAVLVAFAEAQRLQGDLTEARNLYRRALESNPYYMPAWYGLAGLEADSGHVARAAAIVKRLDAEERETGWWRWDKALLVYQLGLTDILAQDIAYLVEYVPSKRRKALDLAFSLWPDPGELLQRLGNRNALFVFRHALRQKKVDFALFFWPLVEDAPEIKEGERLWFIELLRRDDRTQQAATVWKKYFDDHALLHNGDFSSPLLYNAFGWRIWRNGKKNGVHWRLEKQYSGSRKTSMHIWFDGSTNVNLAHPAQVVVLEPDRQYLLSGSIRTENLTTDQRPFFEVVGSRCRAVSQKTEMVLPDQDWTPFSLRFEVPENCTAMLIRLRRKPSLSIDNRINGDIWFSDLKLQPVPLDPARSTGEQNMVVPIP